VVINSAKTVGQKVGAHTIGEPRGPKSGGGAIGVYAYANINISKTVTSEFV